MNRFVSVSGATHSRLAAYCDAAGIAMSKAVEASVSDLPPSTWELAERDARGHAILGPRGRTPGTADDRLRAMHADGMIDKAIAARIGITPRVASKRLRGLGLASNGRKVHPKRTTPRGRTAKAVEALRRGKTIAEAARIAGLDYSSACEAKRRWIDSGRAK